MKANTIDSLVYYAREITTCWNNLGSVATIDDTTFHICKEVEEFLQEETSTAKAHEIADIMILCTHWLVQNGFDPNEVITEKGEIVLKRHALTQKLIVENPNKDFLWCYKHAKELMEASERVQ